MVAADAVARENENRVPRAPSFDVENLGSTRTVIISSFDSLLANPTGFFSGMPPSDFLTIDAISTERGDVLDNVRPRRMFRFGGFYSRESTSQTNDGGPVPQPQLVDEVFARWR